jgi:CBS domain-containing protein
MTEPAERKQSLQPPAPATAGDVMRPALTTLEPNDHVAAAAYLMKHANSTALVVVEDEETKQPTGLITDTDIVRAVAQGKDVNEIRIHDLMTTTPTAIHPTTSIREAARIMLAGHFRHLPVVDETGLVGMVEISDVCGALLDLPGDLPGEPPVSNG